MSAGEGGRGGKREGRRREEEGRGGKREEEGEKRREEEVRGRRKEEERVKREYIGLLQRETRVAWARVVWRVSCVSAEKGGVYSLFIKTKPHLINYF